MLFRMFLIETGGLHTGVATECHDFAEACPSFHHAGERGFPQVVKPHGGQSFFDARSIPDGAQFVGGKHFAFPVGEQVTVGRVFHIVVEVLGEWLVEEVRVGDCARSGEGFRGLYLDCACSGLGAVDGLGFGNADGVVGEVDVFSLEGADFAFPQAADSGKVDGEPVLGWHERVEAGELVGFGDDGFMGGAWFVGLYEAGVGGEEGWVAVFVSACRTVENGFKECVSIMACDGVFETMMVIPVGHHSGCDLLEGEVPEGGEKMVGYLFPVLSLAGGFERCAVCFQMRVIPLFCVVGEEHSSTSFADATFSNM